MEVEGRAHISQALGLGAQRNSFAIESCQSQKRAGRNCSVLLNFLEEWLQSVLRGRGGFP